MHLEYSGLRSAAILKMAKFAAVGSRLLRLRLDPGLANNLFTICQDMDLWPVF